MDAVFLDLDGTLIDPRAGITDAIRHALREMGADVPAPEDLTWCIGPPLWHSFEVLLGPGADLDRAVDLYREHFTAGALFEADLYDGVGEMLEALHGTGAGIWIATSKPHVYAKRIVDHFGISSWIDGLFGSELDGTRSDKTVLLAHALAETGAAARRSVMLGDRRHDVFGARNNAIPAIGALWGFAEEGELHHAEPDALAGHPLEVGEIVAEMMGLLD